MRGLVRNSGMGITFLFSFLFSFFWAIFFDIGRAGGNFENRVSGNLSCSITSSLFVLDDQRFVRYISNLPFR